MYNSAKQKHQYVKHLLFGKTVLYTNSEDTGRRKKNIYTDTEYVNEMGKTCLGLIMGH